MSPGARLGSMLTSIWGVSEASTIAIYDTKYKKLVEYCVKFGKVLFGFRESDVVNYLIYRSGVFYFMRRI